MQEILKRKIVKFFSKCGLVTIKIALPGLLKNENN